MELLKPKQRLIRAIRGQEVDHVPFSPFLAYYFDYLPEEIRKQGDLKYIAEMGGDPLSRGGGCAFKINHEKCTSSTREIGNKRYTTFSTPKGEFYSEYTYVENANTWFITKHPIEDEEGLEMLRAYYEDVEVVPNFDRLNESIDHWGDDALIVPVLGVDAKTAFQCMIETWVGTENLVYLYADCPDLLDEVVDLMHKKSVKTAEISVQSKGDVFISWEDSSTTNVNPEMYKRYIAPEIASWCKILENEGKTYIQHACGHVKDLLIPMAEEGIRAIESISPPPTGNVTIKEARAILPDEVGIVGGIEPVQIMNDSIEELLEYSKGLLRLNKGKGFVLANSDSCPPHIEYEKFLALARLVKEYQY